jgi:hypothetical protein
MEKEKKGEVCRAANRTMKVSCMRKQGTFKTKGPVKV